MNTVERERVLFFYVLAGIFSFYIFIVIIPIIALWLFGCFLKWIYDKCLS